MYPCTSLESTGLLPTDCRNPVLWWPLRANVSSITSFKHASQTQIAREQVWRERRVRTAHSIQRVWCCHVVQLQKTYNYRHFYSQIECSSICVLINILIKVSWILTKSDLKRVLVKAERYTLLVWGAVWRMAVRPVVWKHSMKWLDSCMGMGMTGTLWKLWEWKWSMRGSCGDVKRCCSTPVQMEKIMRDSCSKENAFYCNEKNPSATSFNSNLTTFSETYYQ